MGVRKRLPIAKPRKDQLQARRFPDQGHGVLVVVSDRISTVQEDPSLQLRVHRLDVLDQLGNLIECPDIGAARR